MLNIMFMTSFCVRPAKKITERVNRPVRQRFVNFNVFRLIVSIFFISSDTDLQTLDSLLGLIKEDSGDGDNERQVQHLQQQLFPGQVHRLSPDSDNSSDEFDYVDIDHRCTERSFTSE